MKFTAEKMSVLNAVKKVGSITASRAVIPVLANILFEADSAKNEITVTSTNMDLRLECRFQAQVQGNGGKTTIPGRKLLMVLSAMQGSEVEFSTDEQHHTSIKCGKAKVKLLGLPPDDFPCAEEFTAKCLVTLPMEQFVKTFKEGSYLVSADQSRKALCGIYTEFDKNNFHVVSTNGKALAYSSSTLEKAAVAEKKESAIVPVATFLNLAANAKADIVNIGFDDKKIMAWAGDMTVYSKLIEGNYPNYNVLVKDSYTRSAVLPVQETIAKLSLLNAVVTSDSPSVDLTISGNSVKLSAESAAAGAVDDEMELFEGVKDESFTITINPALMLSVFEAHKTEEKCTLNFDDPVQPVEFKFNDSIAIIMPIRKKEVQK